MLRRILPADVPLIWIGFTIVVTWLDWVGLISYFFAAFPLVLSRIAFLVLVVLLLVGLCAVLRATHTMQILRMMLALSIVWLLVLPFIPWTPQKALITRYSLLVPGMSKATVQAIMTAHSDILDVGNTGDLFCAETDWKDGACPPAGTFVVTQIVDDMLVSAEIELD